MTSIFKAALICAIFTGFAAPSAAEDIEADIIPSAITEISESGRDLAPETAPSAIKALLPAGAKIGIAHIHNGEMIIGLSPNTPSWNELSAAADVTLNYITPLAYFNAMPRATKDGTPPPPSENVRDEIRLAAVDSDMPYLLLHESTDASKAKILLMDSYSGAVLGDLTPPARIS